MKKYCFMLVCGWLLLSSGAAAEVQIIRSHALVLHDGPKYPAEFTHFEYVNPDAPKGGLKVLHHIGTFDNFNRYAQRGVAAPNSTQFYDQLMVGSEDEVEVYYGLIAGEVEYPSDYSWIIFHLRPEARHQDGKSITAQDVVFSFYKFFNEGVPQFKQFYKPVLNVEALDEQRVKFTLETNDKKMLLSVAQLTILPKHYWENRDLSEPLTEIPLGSGVYTVKDYKIGQYVTYQRLSNYWAKDLSVNKGRHNFDEIRHDCYRDETVAFEAFKAGQYDFRQENIARNWATLYTGPGFDAGHIMKEEIPHKIPQGMQAFVFNIQRTFFADRRVRMAINYALDFEWLNKNLFHDQYVRTRSYFQNTEYEARGLPGKEELSILKPLADKIPAEVFTHEYQPPVTDGTGNIRPQLRAAIELLKAAGWELRNKKMVDIKTGKPLEFELLLHSSSMERVAVPFQRNLERLGIKLNIRLVDTTQFINRLRSRDFDMISNGFSAQYYPDDNMKIVWRSDYLDFTYNTAGVTDPAVDALIDIISANQEDKAMLLSAGRALDRVLTWNHYVVPHWHLSTFRIAWWKKFARPEIRPKYNLGLSTWWLDQEQARRLPRQ